MCIRPLSFNPQPGDPALAETPEDYGNPANELRNGWKVHVPQASRIGRWSLKQASSAEFGSGKASALPLSAWPLWMSEYARNETGLSIVMLSED
jgi:hypothetical protein